MIVVKQNCLCGLNGGEVYISEMDKAEFVELFQTDTMEIDCVSIPEYEVLERDEDGDVLEWGGLKGGIDKAFEDVKDASEHGFNVFENFAEMEKAMRDYPKYYKDRYGKFETMKEYIKDFRQYERE